MILEGEDAYALTDGAWTKTAARLAAIPYAGARLRGRRSENSTAVLPADVKAQPDMRRTSYRRYPNGLFVGIGRPLSDGREPRTTTGLVIRPGARQEMLVPIPDATPSWDCELASSADGKAYADCMTNGRYDNSSERRLYVLDERTWARVLVPTRDVAAPLAVAKDGSVWMGRAEPARLAVRSPAGRITHVALPQAPDSLVRATYEGTHTESRLPRPERDEVAELSAVADLAPAKDGGMIVLAREISVDGAMVVYRVRAQGDAPMPTVIGSEIDQLVEIRNREQPKRWVGHCNAVFVHLPRGRDAGELSLGPITYGTLVEGKLHDKTVTGVVFADVARTGEDFERVVSGFVERNTTNPAAPPEVTCTLPMLDRVM